MAHEVFLREGEFGWQNGVTSIAVASGGEGNGKLSFFLMILEHEDAADELDEPGNWTKQFTGSGATGLSWAIVSSTDTAFNTFTWTTSCNVRWHQIILDCPYPDPVFSFGTMGTQGDDPVAPGISYGVDATVMTVAFKPTYYTGFTLPSGFESDKAVQVSSISGPGDFGMAVGAKNYATAGSTGDLTWTTAASAPQPFAFNFSVKYGGSSTLLTPITSNDAGGGAQGPSRYSRTTSWSEGTALNTLAQLSDAINQPITPSAASGDTGIGPGPGYNSLISVQLDLEPVPANFITMDTLAVRYSTVDFGPYSDDEAFLQVRVRKDTGALLASSSSTASSYLEIERHALGGPWSSIGGNAGPAYNKQLTFNYVDTAATKADWDDAFVEFRFSDDQNMGSDSAAIILVDFELTGTYTSTARGRSENFGRFGTRTRVPFQTGAIG